MPEKLMLVTTGTSLFESASWGDGDWINDEKMEVYREWLKPGSINEPGPLISHNKRVRHERAEEIISFFEENLTVDNAKEWANYFAKEIKRKPGTLRYSAELSTIFDFAMKKRQDWQGFLNEYQIQFICDENETSLSRIAAEHSLAYLKSIEKMERLNANVKTISGLSSTISDELRDAFDNLQNYFMEQANINFEEVVIIISGGYKIYPLAFSSIFCENENNNNIKIIYRYEEINQILEMIPQRIVIHDEYEQRNRIRIPIADMY